MKEKEKDHERRDRFKSNPFALQPLSPQLPANPIVKKDRKQHRPQNTQQIPRLDLNPQPQHTLRVLHNLITTELTLTVQPIDKANRHLSNRVPRSSSAHHHFHLEGIPLTLGLRDDAIKDMFLVQSEGSREIADTGLEHDGGEQIRATGHKLPLQIPTVHAAVARVPRPCHDIEIPRFLEGDELCDEFRLRVGVLAG